MDLDVNLLSKIIHDVGQSANGLLLVIVYFLWKMDKRLSHLEFLMRLPVDVRQMHPTFGKRGLKNENNYRRN